MMTTILLYTVPYIVLCVAYVGGSFFFQKKKKPSIWNSLTFGGLLCLLACIFRGNYLLRLPNTQNTTSIMVLIYASIAALIAGYGGTCWKEKATYKWNILFLRPVVLELGFAGLALPCLHQIPFLQNGMYLGIIPMTFGMFLVIVTEVILNVIDKEYRIKLWKQLLYGIIMVSLTTLLIVMTGSVWLTLIPRGIYALTNHLNHRFKGGKS